MTFSYPNPGAANTPHLLLKYLTGLEKGNLTEATGISGKYIRTLLPAERDESNYPVFVERNSSSELEVAPEADGPGDLLNLVKSLLCAPLRANPWFTWNTEVKSQTIGAPGA